MTEIWRDVVGYEGSYMISSLGRVKSLNYRMTDKEEILRPMKDKKGYLCVRLYKNNKGKFFKVHRLVAAAFIDNPYNKPCIDHINTIRDDNRVENLRWCTAKENANNPISRKRYLDNAPLVGKFGKDHFNFKPVYQYSLDNKLIRKFDFIGDAADSLGISHSNISACCRGKRKTCGGYKWRYA